MKKLLLIISVVLVSMGVVNAQYHRCGTMEQYELMKLQDPGYEQRLNNIEQLIQNRMNNDKSWRTTGVINIPVVFHILYSTNNATQNISNARIMAQMDVLNQDYIRTAYAKGLSRTAVIWKHSLRNALNPVITTISASLAATLGGVFFIEYIFNWPGIGLLAIDAIFKLDFPMIQGTVLFSAIVFVIINFFVDIIYAVLDPKVKLS